MLETPKSAKTPSTPRIPNSCATSAILENGACTSITFAPKILSRTRANSSACASRPVLCAAIRAPLPTAPACAAQPILQNLNSQVFERLVVFVCIRLVLQLVQNSCVVHDFQIVQVPKDVHVSLGLRRFP